MKRTGQQNKSIHVACKLLSDTLNASGLDQRKVLKPSVSIPWTPIAVKDQLFRPIMLAMTSKKSTTELEKQGEIDEIWDTIMRFLGEKHHVEYIPWPSHEIGYHEKAHLINEK